MARGRKTSPTTTVLLAIIALGVLAMLMGVGPSPGFVVTPSAPAAPVVERDLAATPTITLYTPDKYNPGTAVTTQNMYRRVIAPGVYGTWVDVAGAGTFSLAPGTEIEYVIGIDSDDESAEPYGRHVSSWVVPNQETPSIVEYVANDAAATDLTDTYFDEYDDANTAQSWSAADIKTLGGKFTGKYEYDFGAIDCGEMSNVLVVRYNNTQIDKIDVTSIVDDTGKSYPVTETTVPVIQSSATGTVQKAYKFPVIESNNGYKFKYSLDGDDSIAVNTSITALTWYLYDSAHYLDSNDNLVKCGVEDEDDAEIGAAAADTIAPSIGA